MFYIARYNSLKFIAPSAPTPQIQPGLYISYKYLAKKVTTTMYDFKF